MEFELIDGSKLEELLTNTVATLVITLPDRTKVELVNEPQLLEQIAKAIEATCSELCPIDFGEHWTGRTYDDDYRQYLICSHKQDAETVRNFFNNRSETI